MHKIILQRDGNENASKDSEEDDSSEVFIIKTRRNFRKLLGLLQREFIDFLI